MSGVYEGLMPAVAINADGMPMRLLGDATRLRQALLNYAGNAVKFTEQGGVTLRARLLESGADGRLRLRLRFEAVDSGVGIAAERLPRLFSDFEQADASTTRQYGGHQPGPGHHAPAGPADGRRCRR